MTDVKALGGYHGPQTANLTWRLPAVTDLDTVIVRMAAGTAAPASPGSGTPVYSGPGTTVKVTGLTGSAYTFAIWIRDRAEKLSRPVTTRLLGTVITADAPASVPAGTTVTVIGTLRRQGTNTPIEGGTMSLYGRRKGTSTWIPLTASSTGANGSVSYVHRPSATWEYSWRYNGSATYLTSQRIITVTVL